MPRICYRIHSPSEQASITVAAEIATLIKQRADRGTHCVLGLATGSTPLAVYRELIRLHREENLSFQSVVTFNLDEYLDIGRDHPQSYWRFMHQHFFDHVDLPNEQIHLPPSSIGERAAESAGQDYENRILEVGGIDLQLLGIGRNGHIGFNEPGSPATSRTRLIQLDSVTRKDAATAFGNIDQVPSRAITMGCATILSARSIRLLAFGKHKASIVAKAINEPATESIPASLLQTHPDTCFHLDCDSASELES